MITIKNFQYLKKEYSHYSSWAVWNDEDVKDIDFIKPNKEFLNILQPNIVFVGLNISGKPLTSFSNFHSSNNDSKIRDAFKDTKYYGGYMTDIIKDFAEVKSTNMMKYLKKNPEFEKENIKTFQKELNDLTVERITLLAFGNGTYEILNRNGITAKYQVIKIPHYSARFYNKRDDYIAAIKKILE